MAANITTYTDLVTSEHAAQPKFTAALTAVVQGLVDMINIEISIATGLDLDVAQGQQLDMIGLWVGLSRSLDVPITNVYFAFDVAGVGFDQGIWQGLFDPTSGLTSLPDDAYRFMLRAKILANHWDGTSPGLMAVIAAAFNGTGSYAFVYDNQDMSMNIVASGASLSPINYAMFTRGKLLPKPAGVLVNYITSSTGGSPIFGFDVSSAYIAGYDVGSWFV